MLLTYSACNKATAMVFIWGDKGYPPIRFEYKTASQENLVIEILVNNFLIFWKKWNYEFFENTQNFFDHISATKYLPEGVWIQNEC